MYHINIVQTYVNVKKNKIKIFYLENSKPSSSHNDAMSGIQQNHVGPAHHWDIIAFS